MASFSISYTSTTVTVHVSGLTVGDELRFFIRLDPDIGVALADEKHTATSNSMVWVFDGLSSETNYAVNVRLNGTWMTAKIFKTPPEISLRPSSWYWKSTINPGSKITVSAAEWNSFCAKINEFRNYKNLGNYNFTTVYSGMSISAAIVNQARTAIGDIKGHGTLPLEAVQGEPITSAFFVGLKNALNLII